MAPSQMNLSAVLLVVVLLLPIIMAARESASSCAEHLSNNYEGVCIGLIDDDTCNSVCIGERSDNFQGFCNLLQCWCKGRCTSETEAIASAPIWR
ncbi:unnamed protein product [Miscanthus lutarioriparius]|uniref:Uncharacterized protein n=1 Tax=Miscanthus lutarioriparius TaxID=422564 RepID=A0A811R403_9POAL|nr:unnamed protein product [Miscanthus lutarioriparius]